MATTKVDRLTAAIMAEMDCVNPAKFERAIREVLDKEFEDTGWELRTENGALLLYQRGFYHCHLDPDPAVLKRLVQTINRYLEERG